MTNFRILNGFCRFLSCHPLKQLQHCCPIFKFLLIRIGNWKLSVYSNVPEQETSRIFRKLQFTIDHLIEFLEFFTVKEKQA